MNRFFLFVCLFVYQEREAATLAAQVTELQSALDAKMREIEAVQAELSGRIQESSQFKNMRKMLDSKNSTITELRRKLATLCVCVCVLVSFSLTCFPFADMPPKKQKTILTARWSARERDTKLASVQTSIPVSLLSCATPLFC